MVQSIAVVIALLPLFTFAQIAVHINSGNPAYPFPQFQPYANPTDTLGNLATKNAVGVPHAEMEKSIREAYQIMMNAATKPGGGVGGKDYIRYKSSPQCSEGDGYGLLGAAAMADKETFDGMWLYIHDFTMNKVKRYSDCKDVNPGYEYSRLPGWTGSGSNSATDGDADIGLALLCAFYQWGEFMGITDACGEQINYKKEAIEFLKAITDTLAFADSGAGLLSGDIGLDGYFKGGDSWAELSGWAGNADQTGFSRKAEQPGPVTQYVDYMAPAYFQQFAACLAAEDPAKYAWNISQFKRAEASSDWIMGQLLPNTRMIPCAGHVTLSSSNTATFTQMNEGEDFRLSWRTILGYVWNGSPSYSWDPVTHQVNTGISNTFERDIGRRYAKFLWDTRQAPWGNPCTPTISQSNVYWGPSVLTNSYSVDGKANGSFFLNWIQGAGSPAAIAAQDFNLMAEMYRQCEITWDVETPGDGFLTSVPKYYHGWFRLLGMLVLSGNCAAPSHIKPSANMKVYCDVDKTCASQGEEVSFTLSYRNYGSIDAAGVVIIDTLPAGLSFVSSTGDGSFNQAARTVTWNIGTVPGFKSETGIAPTAGQVSFRVAVGDAAPRHCINHAVIACSNGTGWTSNEYPNVVSATMKRNFVDIVDRPSDDSAGGKVIPQLYGGRQGIHFSCWSGGASASSTMRSFRMRLYNDAQESYIDYSNYRISYFLNDEKNVCISGQNACDGGWSLTLEVVEGLDKNNIKILHEMLIPGQDDGGKWNQRIIVQFSDPADPKRIENLATTTCHLDMYRGNIAQIHRGGTESLRLMFSINSSGWNTVQWDDDWSWNGTATGVDNSTGYPITPDFTAPVPDNPGIPVNCLSPKHCNTADTTIDNVLVEEWDGYTWRKVFGNAPQAVVSVPQSRTAVRNHPLIQSITASSIRYCLPASGPVLLQVLDMKGRVAATIIKGYCKAGSHSVKWADGRLGANVYLLRLTSAEESLLKRFVYVK